MYDSGVFIRKDRIVRHGQFILRGLWMLEKRNFFLQFISFPQRKTIELWHGHPKQILEVIRWEMPLGKKSKDTIFYFQCGPLIQVPLPAPQYNTPNLLLLSSQQQWIVRNWVPLPQVWSGLLLVEACSALCESQWAFHMGRSGKKTRKKRKAVYMRL